MTVDLVKNGAHKIWGQLIIALLEYYFLPICSAALYCYLR